MSIHKLAFLGGEPAFQNTLHVGQPNVGDHNRLLDRIHELLENRWFTNNGPFVQEFEIKIADFVGVKHCVAICNATVGLEIAIRALGMKGEVILPSFTFVATAHALQWQQITPVFCDVNWETHNINPARVEQLITPNTTGIIGVHVWGRACEVEQLAEIAARNNLKLLFDAAHAFGSTCDGKMVGGFGDAEVFSFHATKFLNSFEGGAVVTNDDDLAAKMRLMRNFGFAGLDTVIYVGTNGKMNEISAAMGLTSLESADTIVKINRRNYNIYKEYLAGIPGCDLVQYDETERNNYQYIVVEIDENETGLSRDVLVKILHAENVRARRYFFPGCHRMEPYRSYYPNAGLLLTETERLVQRVLCLPTGTSIGEEEISVICRIIHDAIINSEEVRQLVLKRKESPA